MEKAYRIPLAILALSIALVACGKIPRNRMDFDPTQTMAELANLKATDFCVPQGVAAGQLKDAKLKDSTAKSLPASGPKPALPKAADAAPSALFKFFSLLTGKSKSVSSPQSSGSIVNVPPVEGAKDVSNKKNSAASIEPEASMNGYVDHTAFQNSRKDGLNLGHGGGCVMLPLKDVWARIANYQEFIFDDIGEIGGDAGLKASRLLGKNQVLNYEVAYETLHHTANPTLKFQWLHMIKPGDGDLDHPKIVTVVFNMTTSSSVFGIVPYKKWNGQIILTEVAPSVTSVFIENRADIYTQNAQDSQDSAENLLKKIKEGRPDWEMLKRAQPSSK